MNDSKVVIVVLRQPNRADPNEMRIDPLWEFGSFGCTRCHSKNLMNPARIEELEGCRFAFAQNGHLGFKLVHVTPPVAMRDHRAFAEATWKPNDMPLTYQSAPVLIDNLGCSDIHSLNHLIDDVRRNTPVARFASKFRSRRRPLPQEVGEHLIEVYEYFREDQGTVAQLYTDALPYLPSQIDRNRQATYQSLRKHDPLQKLSSCIQQSCPLKRSRPSASC